MANRTPEDELREEYFALLPDIRKVVDKLETRVRYELLPLRAQLKKHERIVITSRIKECESAIDTLRRRQTNHKLFVSDTKYSLTALWDLAGVRVLAFPRSRWLEANSHVQKIVANWEARPLSNAALPEADPLVFKYNGHCSDGDSIRAELQITPMLIGQFLDIEHSAIYKPPPELASAGRPMVDHKNAVLAALQAFDAELERLIQDQAIP